MTDNLPSVPGHTDIELLLQEGKYQEAAALLSQRLDQFPSDRETNLYLLLVNVIVHGPEAFEDSIDELRGSVDLNETEKDILRRLFLLGYRAAETRGQKEQIWAYQRLLRRLLLDQPLNQPIPKSVEHSLPDADQVLIEPTAKTVAGATEKFSGEPAPQQRLLQVLPISRSVAHAALAVAVLGMLAIPAVYFVSGTGQDSSRHSLTSILLLPSEAENVALTVSEMKPYPEAAGPHQEATLRRLLDAQLPDLRRLSGRGVDANHYLIGSLLIKLKLDETGRVTEVEEVASPPTDTGFLDEVRKEARDWKFSAGSEDAAETTVPLLFMPKGTDPATVTPSEGTLSVARMNEAAQLAAAVVQEPPTTDKKRNEDEKPQKTAVKRQELAKLDASRPNSFESAEEIRVAYRTKHRIRLREEPRFAATGVAELDGGAPVSVLEVRGKWLKVKSSQTENIGFVRKEFLTRIN